MVQVISGITYLCRQNLKLFYCTSTFIPVCMKTVPPILLPGWKWIMHLEVMFTLWGFCIGKFQDGRQYSWSTRVSTMCQQGQCKGFRTKSYLKLLYFSRTVVVSMFIFVARTGRLLALSSIIECLSQLHNFRARTKSPAKITKPGSWV